MPSHPHTTTSLYAQDDPLHAWSGRVTALTLDTALPNRFFAATDRARLLSFGLTLRRAPAECYVEERGTLRGSVYAAAAAADEAKDEAKDEADAEAEAGANQESE